MTSDDEAVAISPEDGSSDRVQADANQVANSEKLDANRAQADADQVLTIERLDTLVTASEVLASAAADVADSTRMEMQTAKRARKRFMVTMFLMVGIAVALLIPLLWLTVSGAQDRARLKDCVSPNGKCFQDEAARRNVFVMNLEKVTVLANVCSVGPALARLPQAQRLVVVTKCIEAGLK